MARAFREVILELMPAQIIAGEFHSDLGRPTKELFSVAGLIFIAEFMDWTTEQAAQEYNDDDVSWLENNGSMSFTMNHIDTEFYGAIPVASGDINGDGRIDIASCAYNLNSVTWWENTDSTSSGEGGLTGDITSFVIAPNPSNGTFKIEFTVNESCAISADIYDVSGRLTLSFKETAGSGAHIIPVSELSMGVYLIQLIQGDIVCCRRVSVLR